MHVAPGDHVVRCFLVWWAVVDEEPAQAPKNGERRSEARGPIELKVEYKRLNTFFADYTKNISRGGTFIKTGRPLPIGTEFLFKLFVPGRDTPLTIHGEVQRIVDASDDTEPGMAIKFVYREGDPQAEISRIVENMMTENFGPKLSARLMARRAGDKSGD
jgi:type IV pilus assembly protein PilZ